MKEQKPPRWRQRHCDPNRALVLEHTRCRQGVLLCLLVQSICWTGWEEDRWCFNAVLVQLFPVNIQDPVTSLGGTSQATKRPVCPLLARMCLWPELNSVEFVGFLYLPRKHKTSENTGYFSMQELSIFFFSSSSAALLRMKQSVIKVTLQQSFKGELYMLANFHCLFILDILID